MRWPGHRLALGVFVGVLALWLAVMAVVMRHSALPPEASGMMLAVFEPGTPQEEIFASLTRAEARVVRPSALGFIWVVAGDEPGLAGRLVEPRGRRRLSRPADQPHDRGLLRLGRCQDCQLQPVVRPVDPRSIAGSEPASPAWRNSAGDPRNTPPEADGWPQGFRDLPKSTTAGPNRCGCRRPARRFPAVSGRSAARP